MIDQTLVRLAKETIRHVINSEGIPGLLGRTDGTIVYVDPSGAAARNKCWARIGPGDSAIELVVNCSNVPQQVNLPVIIADRDGVPTAIRADTVRAETFAGGRPMTVPNHAWAHGRLGPDALYITGLAFLPLMAHPSDPLAMTVTVEQGFYRYSSVESVFPTTTSASLSSYVPTAINAQHFIVLCLNRATNALAVVDGSSSVAPSTSNPFTASIVLTVVSTLADTHYPLAAIRFYTGQTQITAQDIFMDLRLWGGEVGSIAFNDAEGNPADVAAASADGTSSYPSRRDHVHTIAPDIVTNAMLRNSGALTVIGRSANSTGDPADIAASAGSGAVLRESGNVLGFGTVATDGIANDAATNVKLANMAEATIKGRAAGAGTGDPTDLTAAQLNTVIETTNGPWHAHRMSVDTGTRTIAAGYGYVTPLFEIPSGTVLEIASTGILQITG